MLNDDLIKEHLKYVAAYYDFSDKIEESLKAYMLAAEYVISYDGHYLLSDAGNALIIGDYSVEDDLSFINFNGEGNINYDDE